MVTNVDTASFSSPLTLVDEFFPVLAGGNDEPDDVRLVSDSAEIPVLDPPFPVPF